MKHKRPPLVVEVEWSISLLEHTPSRLTSCESNVVIRGESTTEMAKKIKGTSPGSLSSKTVFKCTFGEHIGVFNNDPKGANFGIINVELDGCPVMFWPALKTDSKSLKGYRWTAEDMIGMGENKVVVGNKIHDVTYQHPNPDDSSR